MTMTPKHYLKPPYSVLKEDEDKVVTSRDGSDFVRPDPSPPNFHEKSKTAWSGTSQYTP